jgi:tetratricopeptide (TPR) repeat protein
MSRLDEILRALDRRRPHAVFLDTLPSLPHVGRARSAWIIAGVAGAAVALASAVGTVLATGAALAPRPHVAATTIAGTPVPPVAPGTAEPSASQLVAQAQGAAAGRDWSEASRLFERALAFDPTDLEAWNGLGVTRTRAGQRPAAIEAFREALRLAPDDPETHRNLAVVLEGQGQLREAIGHYNAFLAQSGEDHPGRAAVRRRLADLTATRAAP